MTLWYIIGKKVIFSNFRISGSDICCVVRQANAAYMVWCTPNIYWANLVQKFKIVSLS